MIKLLLLAVLLCSAGLRAEVIFALDFDDYSVKPGIAAGDPSPRDFTETDLQLRMFPGVNGKGNSLNLANSETLTYASAGNFEPRQGTVSLWISPQNWQMQESGWQVFFHANQRNYWFRIFRIWPNYIGASVYYNHSPGKAKAFSIGVQARVKPEDWKPGVWHKIDVTWNEERMNLYIDARIPEKTPTIIGDRSVPPTSPQKTYPTPMQFPEANGNFSIGLQAAWQKRDTVNSEHKTAYDSVVIHNRLLNAAEILAEYERVIPPVKKEPARPHFSIIPVAAGQVSVDGNPAEECWQQSGKFFLLPLKSSREIAISAQALHDRENLYLSFVSGDACQLRKHNQRDAKLWEDSCFEFHLQTPDNNYYQFIVNGNGAIYDALNKDAAWNSSARAAAVLHDGSWSVELAIPLAELGGYDALSAENSTADFCASTWDSLSYQLFHWGSDRSFAPHDEIRLGKDEQYFRIESLGDLRLGNLSLETSGSSKAQAEASILPEGYSPIVYPENLNNRIWERRLPAGRQRLQVESPGLYFYSHEYTVSFPLEIRHNCRPDAGEIEVSLDLSNAGGEALKQIAATAAGRVQLLSPEERVLSEREFSISTPLSKVILPFPAERLTEGVYSINAQVLEFSRSISLRIPDLAPYQERLGVDHTIPPPWEPLQKLSDNRYQVWGRVYEFAEAPLPVQITAGDSQLLSRPPSWQLNGQEPQWTAPAVQESHPDYVKFAGAGTAGALRIDWVGELWFDGAYLLRFTLSAGAVQDFSISWQVPREFAKFVLNPLYVPWDGDEVVPGDTARKDNVIWLSGPEKGIFFWHQSDANFFPQQKPLRAVRDERTATASVNIISQPATFTAPAEYTMVFMGTPSRPAREDSRMINYGGYSRIATTHQSICWGGFHAKRHKDDMISLNSFIPADPEYFQNLDPKIVRRHIYAMPCMVSNVHPAYDYFGQDNWCTPRKTHQGVKLGVPWTVDAFCMNASERPADLQCWEIDQTMRRYPGVNGIYFDVASTGYCENQQHGCGGIDALGQHYRSSNALGYRRFLLRIYKTVKKNQGSIMLHSHVQFMPMTQAFVDFFAPGENTFHTMATNLEYGYCEGISLEEYQSDFNWRKAGVTYCMLLQTGRAAGMIPALKQYEKAVLSDPKYAYSALAPMLQHDLNVWGHYVSREIIGKFWDLRAALNFAAIKKFHAYWESSAVTSGSEKVLCSWYEWDSPQPYRRLLLISNFNRDPKPLQLRLDFAALGVPEPALYYDIWTNKEMTPADLEQFQLGGNNFLMLGIK